MNKREKPSAEERGDRGWGLTDDECACIHLIRYFMKKTHTSRAKLAAATGVGPLYIRSIVNFDTSTISYYTLWTLLYFFDISLLIDDDGRYILARATDLVERGMAIRS